MKIAFPLDKKFFLRKNVIVAYFSFSFQNCHFLTLSGEIQMGESSFILEMKQVFLLMRKRVHERETINPRLLCRS